MARSVKWLIAGFLSGALVVGLWFWFFYRIAPPSPEALAAMDRWINTKCTFGEGHQDDDALRMYASEVETPLIELFEKGPPLAQIRRVESIARRDFERTRDIIRSGVQVGLSSEDKQALLAMPVDAWAKRAGEEFVSSRRAAALAGLGVTGGSKGRRLLKKIADDPNSPFQDVARLASPAGSSAATSIR